jgi:transposase
MSKARLVITAVVAESRSQGEVARAYGVSQGWVSRLVARYRVEGEAAFEPRSRRPKISPSAIPETTVELIAGLRKELADAAWTPARTPSPGTCFTTTRSGSRPRR